MNSVTRRDLLKTSAAFVVGFRLSATPTAGDFAPNGWIRVSPDNRIAVIVEVPELGQGPRTADVMLLADEMEADWASIQVEQAPVVSGIYSHLATGGSGATREAWKYMRVAGAQARETLVTAAAKQWSVPREECRAEQGTVVHTPSSRRLTYGELVETASKIPVADPARVGLKKPSEFRLIGKAMLRTDAPAKVDGSARFGLDVRVPGMKFAVIARCPHFGGSLASFDAAAAKALPGVRAVFAVPPIGFTSVDANAVRNINVAGGVAVIADSTWAAIQARKALKISWDKGPGAGDSSTALRRRMVRESESPPLLIPVDKGQVLAAFNGSERVIEATYELPFQAHATMEPMNTTVHVRKDQIEVWSPTQIAAPGQYLIAHLAGIPRDKVTIHMMLCGGSFGRRYQWDYLAEAWQVAKEFDAPVQLMWTREDDMQHGFYRQYSYHRMSGAVDEQGRIAAWRHRIVSTPIRTTFDTHEALKDPNRVASAELIGEIPYDAANFRLEYSPVDSLVPRAWWRSVESSFHTFAVECFVDELARAAGIDPLEFRLRLLRPEMTKLGQVLQLAADKSGWGAPLPAGEGRGIAGYFGFGSYVAYVAEVSVAGNGTVRLKRIVSAVDCGTAVNLDGVRAMVEGAVNFALTPVLAGEITIEDGTIRQSNFHDYRVLRIDQAPEIEVHLVPSDLPPEGMGEPGVPPLAPAVANAIFAATGKRVRRLPLSTGTN